MDKKESMGWGHMGRAASKIAVEGMAVNGIVAVVLSRTEYSS